MMAIMDWKMAERRRGGAIRESKRFELEYERDVWLFGEWVFGCG